MNFKIKQMNINLNPISILRFFLYIGRILCLDNMQNSTVFNFKLIITIEEI